MGGFFSLREQMAQELGPEAEAEMVQRAGFASAERFITAGRDSGELTADEAGFHRALGLISTAGYGQFRAAEVRFDQRFARVAVEGSLEGWIYRESGTRPTAVCDFVRGLLAGTMHFLAQSAIVEELDDEGDVDTEDGVDISCIETSCVAAGEESCLFVLGTANSLLADGLQPAPMAHSSVRETLLRLNRQLEQILDSSRKDPLTKLYNRSYFESALRQKIGYAKRRSDVVSLAIIDIDYFKTINDTQGHTVGDRVLRQIARHLEIQARENDVVARLGGDEFVWLMPATTGDVALAVAQRLRRTLEDIHTNIGFSVSASIGVANYPTDATSPSDLFERADTALFASKRAGRDRAMKFSPDQLATGGPGIARGSERFADSPEQVAPRKSATDFPAEVAEVQSSAVAVFEEILDEPSQLIDVPQHQTNHDHQVVEEDEGAFPPYHPDSPPPRPVRFKKVR